MLNSLGVPISKIGMYNVAYMWGGYMEIVGNAVGMAVGPSYLKIYQERNGFKEAKKLTVLLQTGFICGCFVVAVWSRELFLVFIHNESLIDAYAIAIIVIMSYAYRPLYWQVVTKLQFDEKTSKMWRISLIAGIINIVLNAIFIPVYGYEAAAVTTFIAMIYQGFSGYFIERRTGHSNRELLMWLAFIVFATTVAFLFKDTNWLNKVLMTIIALVVVFFQLFNFAKQS